MQNNFQQEIMCDCSNKVIHIYCFACKKWVNASNKRGILIQCECGNKLREIEN